MTTATPSAPAAAKTGGGTTPDTMHPHYGPMAEAWKDCRDLYAGTRAIHAARTRYLKQHPQELDADYERRATSTEVYNGYGRTISALAGLVTQRDPELAAETSETFKAQWENIDGLGTHGAIFTKRLFTDALITGLAGILVDYPAVANPDGVTRKDERDGNLRPYWIPIKAEDVINWRWAKKGSALVLQQLVLRETVEQRIGRFGTDFVTRYRVFERPMQLDEAAAKVGVVDEQPGDEVVWEVWTPKEPEAGPNGAAAPRGPGAFEVQSGVVRNQTEIPFAPLVIGNSPGAWGGTPPLLDLADVNLAHYRVSADRRHVMHLACVPIPVRTGYTPKVDNEGNPIVQPIGPNVLMDLGIGGDFKWVEVTGSALQPTGDELKTLVSYMANLGLAFLQHETRQAETATAKRLDKAPENATLVTSARGLGTCLTMAAKYHAAYTKEEGRGIAVNTEFERVMMETGLIAELRGMEVAGQLSLDTLWDMLVAGHVLPEDFDKDDERARIAAAGPRQPALELVKDGDPDSPYRAGQTTPPTGGGRPPARDDDDKDPDAQRRAA